MSESNDSQDGFADESRSVEHGEEENSKDVLGEKKVPRHLRFRYWQSWEEMRLVELWRKHFNEITTLETNLPIFRTLAVSLKDTGFHLNAQEVRRKIHAIKTKYIAERRMLMESGDPEKKSSWRLYPLVHDILNPRYNHNENKDMKVLKILEETKSDPLYHILMSGLPVVETLTKIESGEAIDIPQPIQFEKSFPIENTALASSIAYGYENKYKLSYTPRHQRPSEIKAQQARLMSALAAGDASVTRSLEEQNQLMDYIHMQTSKPKMGILKRHATMQSIKQIRLENLRLAEECIIARKQLKLEEKEFIAYGKMVEQIQAQYENFLREIQPNISM